MTRREFVWHFVVISAAMLTLAGVAGKLLTAVPHAQSSTPYLEPTSTCPAVSFWFADGVYRLQAGRFAGYQPRLTL